MPKKDETLLRGEDLLIDGTYVRALVTIEAAEQCDRDNGQGGKLSGLLVRFVGKKKPFFAPEGKTNHRLLKCELGTTDTEKLVGGRLVLVPVIGNWLGEKNVIALRIEMTEGKPKPMISRSAYGKVIAGKSPADFDTKTEQPVTCDLCFETNGHKEGCPNS